MIKRNKYNINMADKKYPSPNDPSQKTGVSGYPPPKLVKNWEKAKET